MTTNPSLIAILTDFGTEDIYTGVMKGVIYNLCPDAHIVNITHMIEPQNVRQAAFALLNAYNYFPKGTVFLVVVDPGVGSTRRPIAVRAGDYAFVGPDNGVLSYTLAQFERYDGVELTNTAYHLSAVSYTFHGRDIFAPIAARLASGIALEELGSPLSSVLGLPQPELLVSGRRVSGEVVDIDRFGNLITSIGHLRGVTPERLSLTPVFGEQTGMSVPVRATDAVVTVHGENITGLNTSYSEMPRGELIALVGSAAYLEIAVNQGSAARRLDVAIGDRVELAIGDIDAAIRY
ncbi:MAG: SAM-dependent chlorinase/fluorinase [bacterium]|nr:SAM-dependent chlorinase/fluorinase [bacterium]